MGEQIYHLGASRSEQERLHNQRILYGDTSDIIFDPTDKVCDFGCGPLSNYWIPQAAALGEYTGVDNQPAHIEKGHQLASELGLTNVSLVESSVYSTELSSGYFDVGFARCLLIHLPEPQRAVSELLRLVRQGGRIILIEPHDPTYYVTPDKPNLLKVYRARDRQAYFNGRGCPDAALNLHTFLTESGALEVQVRPHVIFATGNDPDRCQAFLQNWLGLIQPIVSSLISEGKATEQEWELARQEAETVAPETFLYQSMWIAEARKP
jgi:SAM-dependent methyltransferase